MYNLPPFRSFSSLVKVLLVVMLLAFCWEEVKAAPQPQSPSDSFTEMFRRGFMRIISIPAQTLNMFFRNSQDGGGGGQSGTTGSGLDGRSQVPGFAPSEHELDY